MTRATARTATARTATSRTATASTTTARTASSRTAIHEGDRQLRRSATRFGEEFRLLRLRTGVSQAAVARAIGVDRVAICRIEAGAATVSDRIRARAAAVLGAEFRVGIYPATAPLIHDAAHARLVELLLRLRHPSWHAKVEAPVPGSGRRSTDLRLDRGPTTILVEVETHVHALEAIIREGEEKRAFIVDHAAHGASTPHVADAAHASDVGPASDAGPATDQADGASPTQVARAATGRRVHVVLALPPTRHHRNLVTAHPGTIRTAFPASSADILRALTSADAPWPGNGILWLAADARGRVASSGLSTGPR